jgi:flagellin-specific chaperone FliS
MSTHTLTISSSEAYHLSVSVATRIRNVEGLLHQFHSEPDSERGGTITQNLINMYEVELSDLNTLEKRISEFANYAN